MMEIQSYFKSKASKVFLGVIGFFSVIMLAKFGYLFGQWLHNVIN